PELQVFRERRDPGFAFHLDVLYSEREHLDQPEREEQAHHPAHHCHGCGTHLARRLGTRRYRDHGDRQAEREALEREADQGGGIEYSRDRPRVLVETPGGETVHGEVGSHEHEATAKNGERCHRYPGGQHPRQKFAFNRIHVFGAHAVELARHLHQGEGGVAPSHRPSASRCTVSRASLSLTPAAWISSQVFRSTGMPSFSRLRRISRSGSPAMRTLSNPGAGRPWRNHSRNSRASRSKAGAVPRRAGSITIASMPFSTRCCLLSS